MCDNLHKLLLYWCTLLSTDYKQMQPYWGHNFKFVDETNNYGKVNVLFPLVVH